MFDLAVPLTLTFFAGGAIGYFVFWVRDRYSYSEEDL